jgi:tRNA(adenine34) deaminase
MGNPAMENDHEKMMQLALAEAEKAGQNQEVPIGAVLVAETGDILAKAYNRTIGLADPTGHAEILAMRAAAQKIKNYRLLNTTLYVTVEPCVMCMGAIMHARIARVVYGAPDPKWGALGSLYNFADGKTFNHHPEIVAGVRAEACREIIQAFFKSRRRAVKGSA